MHAAHHRLTLDATATHLVRAALESVAFQTLDLTTAMGADGVPRPAALRVDGGIVANNWLCQFLADVLETPVERPCNIETTALGAAFLAGLAIGFWPGLDAIAKTWAVEKRFEPGKDRAVRESVVAGWKDALERTLL